MIHAYNKEYVSDAMENLGEAFDYAVHAQNLDLNRFSSLFVNASASKSIENGNPKYVSGMSGTELALTVLSQNGLEAKPVQSLVNYEKSSECFMRRRNKSLWRLQIKSFLRMTGNQNYKNFVSSE